MPKRWLSSPGGTLVLIGAGVLVAALSALAAREWRGVVRVGVPVRHALEVVARSDAVLARLLDADGAQRRFVLSGDERHLEPHAAAVQALLDAVLALRETLASDSLHAGQSATVGLLVEAKRDEWARSIELRRRVGVEAALEAVRTDADRGLTDEIRGLLGEISAVETSRLRDLIAERTERARRANAAALAIGLASLVSISAAVLALHRSSMSRLRAQRAALESTKRLAVTLSSIGDAVVAVDDRGAIAFSNPAAEKLVGVPATAAAGRELKRLVRVVAEHDGSAQEHLAEIVGRARDERSAVALSSSAKLVRSDGVTVPIQGSAAPILDDSGHPLGVVLVLRDVTQQQRDIEARESLTRAQAERSAAEQASRSKDDFLATLSHELRSPLNAILSWIEVAKATNQPDGDVSRALETIERNSRAMAHLVDDLLDISRIVAGNLQLDLGPLDFGAVTRSALSAVGPTLDAKALRIRCHLPAEPVMVWGDARRLTQVLINVLTNARKFTPEGGSIDVELERTATCVRLYVRDSGQGISAEFLPFVFDRFRQADASSSRAEAGLGIGLALVRHLVELQGGRVVADSAGLGRGATFMIELPLRGGKHEEFTPPLHMAGAHARGLHGSRILVVDDDQDARDALSIYLERCGAQVSSAASTGEAIRALEAHGADVVLTDLAMPREDGFALVRRLRELDALGRRHTPVVAISGFASTGDRDRALAAGFDAHLAKPIDFSALLALLSSLHVHSV